MYDAKYALDIKGLRKTFRNGFEALHAIDLRVRAGDFFALLGPNGAGKSTTIGIVSSLVNKTAGRVSIFGIDIDEDFSLAKSYIGVVPQEINFSQFETPLEIVVNQAGYYGIQRRIALERAEKYLKRLALWDRRNENSRNLSGGMKRRLMIARALIHEPRLLILDEPSAGVDIVATPPGAWPSQPPGVPAETFTVDTGEGSPVTSINGMGSAAAFVACTQTAAASEACRGLVITS